MREGGCAATAAAATAAGAELMLATPLRFEDAPICYFRLEGEGEEERERKRETHQ